MSSSDTLYNKTNPFVTELLENYTLNKKGSSKDTRHFAISLKGSGLEYLPGDALYVCPQNEPELVRSTLSLLALDLDEAAEIERFTKEVNITRPSNKLYKLLEAKLDNGEDSKTLAEKFNGYSTAAVLKTYPDIKLTSNEVVENSSKLMARAYSIASSLRAHPEQVDLCIARVEEEINGQTVLGVCSNYLSQRVPNNSIELGVYLHSNERFRLPDDASKPIIMVGPGTGIAPFRAFIEERNADREAGKEVGQDWLFFGDQRKEFDYLYGDELDAAAQKYGLKITTAFSRDQEQKIYVQNRMKENAKEIFDLLQAGAYFYVCGDARRMAKDVNTALEEIFTENGLDGAAEIKKLKDEKRYCRDVY